MSSITRTLERAVLPGTVLRDIALACLAVALTGLSYGAVAVASGFPFWVPAAQSVFVLAGASEFLFIGIVAAGGSPVAAALAGLLVNGRHLPYGLALPPAVTGRGWRRILGTHLMNDETVVFTLAQPDYPRQRAAYWTCGLGMGISWSGGAVLGALIGRAVHDTSAFGLDAMFPAVILALIVPSLRDAKSPDAKSPDAKSPDAKSPDPKSPDAKSPDARTLRSAAALGAVIALAATPFAPAGLPVLLALPAALLLLRERPAAADPP
jgi:4-azaleucine resistance transporter AzlC